MYTGDMDDVEYSKLKHKKRRGKPQQKGPHLEEPSTIIYADIKTSHIQLPVEDTKPNVTENTWRCSKCGNVTKILTVIIIAIVMILALSCAVAVLLYQKFSEKSMCPLNVNEPNSDPRFELHLMEIRKQLCVTSTERSAGCTVCPDGWLRHRESCYYFPSHREYRTWNKSREMCDGMGAQLLIIEDQEEKEFIIRSGRGRAYPIFWIGMYRDGDGWRWADGQRYDTRLSPITGDTSGSCVRIHAEIGSYNNDDCQSKHSWICEKRAQKI